TSESGVPLEKYGDYSVYYRIETDSVYENVNQYVILDLAFELLSQTEGYEYYKEAIEGMKKIPDICSNASKMISNRAMAWGEKMKNEPILYSMASGPSTFVAYMQSICMFMEMEWVNSSSIHTGEYFHGPFEITDKNTPFMLFLSEGRTRPLDERALKFLKNYADHNKVEVIDVKELGINSIDDSVVEFFSPILHWVVGLEYAQGLAVAKKHPLLQRRYMNKVEY
ncbi:MAG: phosphosugar isomerase, partial [Herbinix sp.]|nr:phosphosugar isomerase [Herbinix sp.]